MNTSFFPLYILIIFLSGVQSLYTGTSDNQRDNRQATLRRNAACWFYVQNGNVRCEPIDKSVEHSDRPVKSYARPAYKYAIPKQRNAESKKLSSSSQKSRTQRLLPLQSIKVLGKPLSCCLSKKKK